MIFIKVCNPLPDLRDSFGSENPKANLLPSVINAKLLLFPLSSSIQTSQLLTFIIKHDLCVFINSLIFTDAAVANKNLFQHHKQTARQL